MCEQTRRFDIDEIRAEARGANCESGSQAELGICAYLAFLETEMQLKAVNDAVIDDMRSENSPESLAEADVALFQTAQSAWCAYREAACNFEVGPPPYGSSMGQIKGQCYVEYNRARVSALSRYLNLLSDCRDGTKNCSGARLYMYDLHPDWNP